MASKTKKAHNGVNFLSHTYLLETDHQLYHLAIKAQNLWMYTYAMHYDKYSQDQKNWTPISNVQIVWNKILIVKCVLFRIDII